MTLLPKWVKPEIKPSTFTEKLMLKLGKSEKPEIQETKQAIKKDVEAVLQIKIGEEAKQFLAQKGYFEAAKPTIAKGGIEAVAKYNRENAVVNEVVRKEQTLVAAGIDQKRATEIAIKNTLYPFKSSIGSKEFTKEESNILATLKSTEISGMAIGFIGGGLMFVNTQQAENIIAQSLKSKLTRQDLIDITAGRLKSGVKYDAYKAMAGDEIMRKELTAIAKNQKIPITQKISDYIKGALKSTEQIVADKATTKTATTKALTQQAISKEVSAVSSAITKAVPTIAPEAQKGIVEAVKPEKGIIPQATKDIKEVKPTGIEPSPITPAPVKPTEDPIIKLNQLLKESKPLRKGLEKAYTEERAKRIAKVENIINNGIDKVGGEEGYAQILSQLKGELAGAEAKIAFEPIKNKLTEVQLKDLYLRTWQHPYLDNWEKISTAEGLTKLMAGEIPQPKQLVLMEEVYGTDLIKTLLSKRALGAKTTDLMTDILNIPRAILATADMSGFLRQGIVYVTSHPLISTKAIGKTFQFAFSPKSFTQYFKDLPKDPLYPLMRKAKLSITDPSKAGLAAREETFMSTLPQKIPVLGELVKFAERSYVGFLNKLRVDVFKTLADEALTKGLSPIKDIEYFRSLADVVNVFTGRGSLGAANRIAPQLNTIFFSPRLISARFNAMNPLWYAKMPKAIRMKAISDFAKFVGVGLTVLAIAKASGVDVETDPRSSDFGKIKVGDTRWDIWGGFQQWARVFAQLTTGQRKNTTTGEIISLNKEEYPFTTRKEVLLRFIEGKLAPVPALVNELMSGAKTFTGEDTTFESVVRTKFIPMYIQDISDAYTSGGLSRAVGAGIPAFFGVGVQTYEPRIGSGDKDSPLKLPSLELPSLKMPSTKLPSLKIK